jgi:hypothetical protein
VILILYIRYKEPKPIQLPCDESTGAIVWKDVPVEKES